MSENRLSCGRRAVKCRFLPIFLSTRRLVRHEEMGEAVRGRRNAECRRPRKCQATVPVCEFLRPQRASKRNSLERAGKVKRTRRLTSRKLRADPLSGGMTPRAVKHRSRHTLAQEPRDLKASFLALAQSEVSFRLPSPASGAPVPGLGTERWLRHRCGQRVRPLRTASLQWRHGRFRRASGHDQSAVRRCSL
jgi:hypothetical protein